MKCPKCHSDNPDTKKFCGECGTQLLPPGEISVPTKTLETPIDKLTRGTTFANRYEIIEELGKGGMGKVYKVLDTKIKEMVALKLLKPEIASDKQTIERFSNELKFARKIRHANVCQMYDLNEVEGTHYITMEYVSGQDLKGLIRQTGQLAIGTVISIAKQVCEGLSEAHRLGVVHRDLKPQNIMIDKEGDARIMDFGIARALKAKGITEEGLMIGTPDYMSPEQTEAKDVDHRSDIYSLGVVLYEMVTGRVPFEGDTPLSIAMKQKSEAPRDPMELNAQIPEGLSHVILKCLEKDRKKRYQNAEKLLHELTKMEKDILTKERIPIERKPKAEKIKETKWQNSIAVLPFVDMSPAKDQEYFCDGIAEEIINALTHVQDLRVVARTSAFSFKGKDLDVREIGRKLNVNTILEGSIKKAGNRLRITAQLVNVADGYHLWSERYDRDMEDIFAIEDEISLAIVDKLKVRLLSGEKEKLVKRYTDNLEAYSLYLKGRYYWNSLTPEGWEKSYECYKQAIAIDPDYALAYSGLAIWHGSLGIWGDVHPRKAFSQCRELTLKAIELDDNIADAHSALGVVYWLHDWDRSEGQREYQRGIELEPANAFAHLNLALSLATVKAFDEALLHAKKVQQLDPLSSLINTWAASIITYSGQYEESIIQFQQIIASDPISWQPHHNLSVAYIYQGKFDDAISAAAEAVKRSGGASIAKTYLGCAYALAGQREKAQEQLNSLLERRRQKHIPATFFVWLYTTLEEIDEAYSWLEKAVQDHDPWLCFYGISAHAVRASDPRFDKLIKANGLTV
jgi:serine/threonine protein kinase/Tfp pilus assembly protein PilF